MKIFLDISGVVFLVFAAYNFYMAFQYGNSTIFQTLDRSIHLGKAGIYALLGVLLIIWR